MAAGEIRGGWGRIEPWTVLAIGQVAAFGQTGLLFGFPGGSAVKNLPAMQETQVLSLGWEDLLEEGMATPPPSPAQYSCLENPLDRGAWQATVHEVAKSWT